MKKIIKNKNKKNIDKKFLQQEESAVLQGQEIIKFIAKTLPHKPGIYQNGE